MNFWNWLFGKGQNEKIKRKRKILLGALIPISLIIIALSISLPLVLRCSESPVRSKWDGEFRYGQDSELQSYLNKIKKTHNETKNFVYQQSRRSPNTYNANIYNDAVDYITNLNNFNAVDYAFGQGLWFLRSIMISDPSSEIKIWISKDGIECEIFMKAGIYTAISGFKINHKIFTYTIYDVDYRIVLTNEINPALLSGETAKSEDSDFPTKFISTQSSDVNTLDIGFYVFANGTISDRIELNLRECKEIYPNIQWESYTQLFGI